MEEIPEKTKVDYLLDFSRSITMELENFKNINDLT